MGAYRIVGKLCLVLCLARVICLWIILICYLGQFGRCSMFCRSRGFDVHRRFLHVCWLSACQAMRLHNVSMSEVEGKRRHCNTEKWKGWKPTGVLILCMLRSGYVIAKLNEIQRLFLGNRASWPSWASQTDSFVPARLQATEMMTKWQSDLFWMD
jgi:hypothetical protein